MYDASYFTTLNNEPITAEKFVDGEFIKYLNKDGKLCQKVLGKSSLFEPAEALVRFSYEASNEKFLQVDLWRSISYTFERLQL